jgi:hypothetical protein
MILLILILKVHNFLDLVSMHSFNFLDSKHPMLSISV